jgi:hypothetical protein
MPEVPQKAYELQGAPVDMFMRAIVCQEKLRERYISEVLASVIAPFSEQTKRQIYEWQREGMSTRWMADQLGVTRHKVMLLTKRTSWPSPSNLS